MKVEAIKDGKGNIVISENSFELLLACLDNQKFVHEAPQNGDSLSVGEDNYKQTQESIQDTIDTYNRACRDILHQKYVFQTCPDGFWLTKRYEYQKDITPWSGEDIGKVYDVFKDTKIKWEKPENLIPLDGSEIIKEGSTPIGKTEDGWMVEPESRPWLIERPMRFGDEYLTISEDGITNRPWTQEEIILISKIFNDYPNDLKTEALEKRIDNDIIEINEVSTQKWFSVNTALPKWGGAGSYGGDYLCVVERNTASDSLEYALGRHIDKKLEMCYYNNLAKKWQDKDKEWVKVTHWMQVPELPE